ncbi:MAG: PASTA domain-containing protein [Proteiniphilum sp.]|uniref:PASTA domain-containing protein n=1 Tax=Proteiniphilum sp. TaxID=1926877 RepID=UPI002B20EFBF|nr:PASTA domain-containing protein [Proteiniphilum sp.]MEA5128624.1 PASTA domain-containing protein [Proteiniphilum sp.]
MSKKQTKKTILSNSIVKNMLMIIACGILLVVLALLLLNVYTRHGQNVAVPALENLQVKEANTILRAKGLHAEIVDSIYQRDAVPGAIIDQRPKAGNKVKEGRAIYLTIYARNPQMVAVPELTDYSTRQASALLNSIGFTQLYIQEVPAEYSGLVVAVEYRGKRLMPEEKIPAGSPLTLVITSNTLADSLRIDNEYIVPPGSTGDDIRSGGDRAIDDSFF